MCCLSALLFLSTSCSSAATPDDRPTSDCSGSNRGGYAIRDLPADVTTRGQIINPASMDMLRLPLRSARKGGGDQRRYGRLRWAGAACAERRRARALLFMAGAEMENEHFRRVAQHSLAAADI